MYLSLIRPKIVISKGCLIKWLIESFNVLVKELQGLCLDIRFERAENAPAQQGDEAETEDKKADS